MFRGFGAILYKEFIVILRDQATLFFMFFPPLIEIIAFGFALDNDIKHMAMVVLNEDRSQESRQVIEHFVTSQTFRLVGEVQSVSELSSAIRKGNAYVGLQIPPDFTRNVRAGKPAQIQVLIDGSNSTVALSALNTSIAVGLRESIGILLAESGRRELPVEIRPQMLYNPSMRSPNFFVPGVIGVSLQIATVFATALSLAREREKGTLEQLLVSPLSRWGLMLGKLVPYLCIALVMAVFLFAILRWVFFVPIAGSLIALFIGTLGYLFALLSLGLLVSTRAENHMQAFQISMVVLMPSIFFSGFIFPRETMPWIFYAIGSVLPATYYIDLLRAVVLRGASLSDYAFQVEILFLMGLILFSVCALRFRQKMG
jgi:ABC-2 type transport system permease protein